MNYYNRKYLKKFLNDPLPPLPENERIYFTVPYMARNFAKISHCEFDPQKKLWFTGCQNAHLYALVKRYNINEATSEKAMRLLNDKLKE